MVGHLFRGGFILKSSQEGEPERIPKGGRGVPQYVWWGKGYPADFGGCWLTSRPPNLIPFLFNKSIADVLLESAQPRRDEAEDQHLRDNDEEARLPNKRLLARRSTDSVEK